MAADGAALAPTLSTCRPAPAPAAQEACAAVEAAARAGDLAAVQTNAPAVRAALTPVLAAITARRA